MGKNYVTYHLHDEDSLLDSCTNYKLYVDKAKELNQKAIAFTNHGNIYHWYKKKMYCEENGIKYIHGIECYLTETLDKNIRDNYHTILLAKNFDGMCEINKLFFLSSQSDHVYYKRRLSFDEFLNISDNVIKISACIASPLWQFRKSILNKNNTKERQNKYIQLLKHYDYYEIQYHNFEEQIEYNQFLYRMSKSYHKPLIVGTDTHSLNKYKSECRTILQYGKTDGAWGDSENECDLTYKNYNELIEMFKKQNSLPMDIVLDAINNTNIMADSIEEIKLDTSIKYPLCYGDKDEEVMWKALTDKYNDKLSKGIITNDKRYIDNVKEEMRVFKKTNMIGFMLFMSEMMTWARENNIPTSPCRGSVGGSTVAYISDIIDVDPIKWNTIFSRFANEYRKEVGDIDTDWYEDDRPKVYNYIINRFGKDKTGYILAVGTLADKAVIDTIGRALRKIDIQKNQQVRYTLDDIAIIKKEYDDNKEDTIKKYSDLFYYYNGLVGCVVSQSQHPAGIVASPIDLISNCGMFLGSDGQEILPLDMDEVHEIGLVKYDILGLRNVGIIRECCKYAHIPYPLSYTINWNDQKVFNDMMKNPIGIFQFESPFASDTLHTYYNNCKKDGIDFSIDAMSLCNACIRPSGESYRDRLIARIPNKNPSKIIDDLLESNNGYLVYQEDTIKFLQQICGLSGSDADNVRRAIGRKQIDRLQKALPQILEGYCEKSDQPRDIAEKEARQFLKIIEDSASYQFGYNHSTGYSMLGYLCAYMRYYYPTEFCTGFLNCSSTDEDIHNGTMLANQKGCTIKKPLFRESRSMFSCEAQNKLIYKGIGSIKDIGKQCGENLYSLRNNNYDTFYDLLKDIKDNSLANKTEINILILIDFFKEFGNANLLLKEKELFDKLYSRKTLKKAECESFYIDNNTVTKYCERETDKQFSGVNMLEVLKSNIILISYKHNTIYDNIKYELKYLVNTDIIIKDSPYYAVESIEEDKYKRIFITLYQISNGQSQQYKCEKSYFNSYPCEQGDILDVAFRTKQKKRFIGTDDKGKNIYEDTNETEEIIKLYSIKNKT